MCSTLMVRFILLCDVGLYSHAVKHYECVLELAEKDRAHGDDHVCFHIYLLTYTHVLHCRMILHERRRTIFR